MTKRIELKQIEDKRKTLVTLVKASEAEIKQLELAYLKQEYNLVPTNICKFGKDYGVLNSIYHLSSDSINLRFYRITKDGKISTTPRYNHASDVTKVADNYDDFIKLDLINKK